MAFSASQLRALRRNIDRRNLRTREVENGRVLTYIEGWQAIAEANRIFGFDGWDRETIESRCVLAREIRGAFTAIYIARVRIKVRADGETVIREGHGTGDAQGSHPGEVHDKAIKAAETDATKRALATFGKPFGLGLYLYTRPAARAERPLPGQQKKPVTAAPGPMKSPAAPEAPRHPATSADHERRRTLQRLGPNGGYYVPPRTQPTSDSFHSILANEEAAKKKDVSQPENPSPAKALLGKGTAEKDRGPEITPRDNIRASLAKDTAFLIAQPRRSRDKDHLVFVAKQPCLICDRTPADAHHLRFAQPRAMSKKVSDEFTVPLCRTHHRQLHDAGDETSWWNDMGIDPLPVARALWQQSHGQIARDDASPPIDASATPTSIHDGRKTTA
jgi:hypothetical protein